MVALLTVMLREIITRQGIANQAADPGWRV
jgi:hypothetical protein